MELTNYGLAIAATVLASNMTIQENMAAGLGKWQEYSTIARRASKTNAKTR